MIKVLFILIFLLLGSVLTLAVITKYPAARSWEVKEEKLDLLTVDWNKIQKEILPEPGFTFDIAFDDLGPKLVKTGVIDLKKFEQNFAQSGGLTPEQKEILTQKTSRLISIDQKNANFMADFFWALGLANKNAILGESPMAANKNQLASFASTGGWALGKKSAVDLFSKYEIVKLTPAQQNVVREVSQSVFRPCCDNPASFPDCNHGMAALGLAEYLASKGKGVDEIYKAILYFNSFWFPQNYVDIAAYFGLTGNDWSGTNPKIILGAQFSSGQGYASIKQELNAKLGVPAPTTGPGRGCST